MFALVLWSAACATPEGVTIAGEPIDAVVVFGDHAVDAKGGAVYLRGLPHGPLRAFVSAPGHRSAIVDLVVGPVPRTLRVELPWR